MKSHVTSKDQHVYSCRQEGLQINIFLISPQELTFVVGTHEKRLNEALLMSTDNIWLCEEIKKKNNFWIILVFDLITCA